MSASQTSFQVLSFIYHNFLQLSKTYHPLVFKDSLGISFTRGLEKLLTISQVNLAACTKQNCTWYVSSNCINIFCVHIQGFHESFPFFEFRLKLVFRQRLTIFQKRILWRTFTFTYLKYLFTHVVPSHVTNVTELDQKQGRLS